MQHQSDLAELSRTSFDVFARTAFGIEPGEAVGRQLRAIGSSATLGQGETAQVSRERDTIVYLSSGATKLAAFASHAREHVVAFHFAGDIVSVPRSGAHSFAFTALRETEILLFSAREFFDQAAEVPSIAHAIFERLSVALHRSRDKAIGLACKSASERVAGFLLTMAERIGREAGDHMTVDLPMSRRDIGASLGLTIETVSRQFGALRDAGLIETQGRSIIVLSDLAGLSRRAGTAEPRH